MTEKIYTLQEINEEITDLEAKKEIYKEKKIVAEYIRYKYIYDYLDEKSVSLLENEEFLEAILTIDRLTKNSDVKAYIKLCERLKLFKNVKKALLTEYAAKQKTIEKK